MVVDISIYTAGMFDSDYLASRFAFDFKGFDDPLPWSDDAGISRIRKYPDGFASLFKVGTTREELSSDSPRKKLWVSVSYGEDTADGIRVASGNKFSDPIDLDFSNEFFFDIGSRKFYKKNREISPEQILSEVDEAHMRPLKPIRGFYLRSRLLFWRTMLPACVRILDLFLVVVLYLVSGERVEQSIVSRLFGTYRDRPEIPLKDVEFMKPQTVNFFGYEAKRWSVVFYSLVHLLIFTWLLKQNEDVFGFISVLSGNNFFAIVYIVASFAVTEALLPELLKRAIQSTTKLYAAIAFRTIKV